MKYSILVMLFYFCLSYTGIAQHIDVYYDEEVEACRLNSSSSTEEISCLKSVHLEVDSSMEEYYELLIKSYKLLGRKKGVRSSKKAQSLWGSSSPDCTCSVDSSKF
ncbi:MAG: hypothetical protein JKY52_19480 [Flavobacteriales bacterium]|nr:hypothetical protein [Flavobacteriales bacterium]